MKVVLIIVVIGGIGALAFSSWYGNLPDVSMQVAYGELEGEGLQMDIVLTAAMSNYDSPIGDTRYVTVWQKWVDSHFDLRDNSGNSLEANYENDSTLHQGSRGSPDVGYLNATLEPGQIYTLRYTPSTSEPRTCEVTITAPEEKQKASFIGMYCTESGE